MGVPVRGEPIGEGEPSTSICALCFLTWIQGNFPLRTGPHWELGALGSQLSTRSLCQSFDHSSRAISWAWPFCHLPPQVVLLCSSRKVFPSSCGSSGAPAEPPTPITHDSFCLFVIYDRASFCCSGWSRTHCVAKDGLQLLILLPVSPVLGL